MKISTKGRYALRLMTDLAIHKDDGYISIKTVSHRQGISEKYLEQIIKLLAKENLGKTLLIVAHGAVIRSFWALISCISPEEISKKLPFATNASVSLCEFDGEKFYPRDYSLDAHLESVGITKIKF